MSYVRFGEEGSDVYVYEDPEGRITCTWCSLAPGLGNWTTKRPGEMIAHLSQHQLKGEHVPDFVFTDLAEAKS